MEWPDGKVSTLFNLRTNQLVTIAYNNASQQESTMSKGKLMYFKSDSTFKHTHQDKGYNDFASQSLLMQKYSNQGPGMAVGDLNGDGLEDVFIGGSYGYKSTIHYQEKNGGFKKAELENTELFEDEGALIFDANGDGLNDLYVTSGGSERYEGHKAYQDRLYYNLNGKLQQEELPEMLTRFVQF